MGLDRFPGSNISNDHHGNFPEDYFINEDIAINDEIALMKVFTPKENLKFKLISFNNPLLPISPI